CSSDLGWSQKITTFSQEDCDKDFTGDELFQQLKRMHHNKSPGIDGLPSEWYKMFWNLVEFFLVRIANDLLRGKRMSASMEIARITLLHKKNDPADIKNYRPISLLCVDYKIITSALSSRLLNALSNIIHPAQQGFLPGRNIKDNIMLMDSIIHHCNHYKVPAAVLLLDQE